MAICIENNATGQFARLMRAEAGYVFTHSINRFDGRPFMLEELIGEINGFLGRV
jgi:2-oxoglutarate ferredoxin oxidoreductase subunit alpha